MNQIARKPGRPRKLKEEDSLNIDPNKSSETNTNESVDPIVTERVVETDDGKQSVVSFQGFDLTKLSKYKPYIGREDLPPAVIKYRKKTGAPYVMKNGAPRFFFNGNELIAKYRGLAVKTRLAWRFKPNKPLHSQIRQKLKNIGIPGA